MSDPPPDRPLCVIGRYALYGKLAAGGMATVHFGRLLGPAGFSRTVAIKRLHPQFAKDPEFVAMFLDEARLAARIQHPNVVATVDVVAMQEELFLVMDYVRGESFSRLLRGSRRRGIDVPLSIISNVVSGMLHGLHAAHEARDERGQPLKVVHRDVSPQNVLVGIDGTPRVLDFGVAKAAARIQVTRDGQVKGKLSYMAPEQLKGRGVDRRTDVFAAGVVLWEALTGRRLFDAPEAREVLRMILNEAIPAPTKIVPGLPAVVDDLVFKALQKNPEERFQTARAFAIAVEEALPPASPRAVGEWVEHVAGETLSRREQAVAEIENVSSISDVSQVTDSNPGFFKTLDGQLQAPTFSTPPPGASAEPGRSLEREEQTRVHVPRSSSSDSQTDFDDATTVFEPGSGPKSRPGPPSSFARPSAPPSRRNPLPPSRRNPPPPSRRNPPPPSRSGASALPPRVPTMVGLPPVPASQRPSSGGPPRPSRAAISQPPRPSRSRPPPHPASRRRAGADLEEDEKTSVEGLRQASDYDDETTLYDSSRGQAPRESFDDETTVKDPDGHVAAGDFDEKTAVYDKRRHSSPGGADEDRDSASRSESAPPSVPPERYRSAPPAASRESGAPGSTLAAAPTVILNEDTQTALRRRPRSILTRFAEWLMAEPLKRGAVVATIAGVTSFLIALVASTRLQRSEPAQLEPSAPAPAAPAPKRAANRSKNDEPVRERTKALEVYDPSMLPKATEEDADEDDPPETKSRPRRHRWRAKTRPAKGETRQEARQAPPTVSEGSQASSEKPQAAPTSAAEEKEQAVEQLEPPAGAKPAHCAKPYRVDEKGIRRIKPECL